MQLVFVLQSGLRPRLKNNFMIKSHLTAKHFISKNVEGLNKAIDRGQKLNLVSGIRLVNPGE